MPKGKVKEYDVDRGYGSIVDSETGQVLTVYANSIVLEEDKAKLLEGQAVEFDIERSRNALQAINVAVLDGGGDIHKKSNGKTPRPISQQLRERETKKGEN